jgi:hypothetical protein
LLFQREQFSYQRFEGAIFFLKGLQFFFFRHGCTLLAFLCFGKSVGDLSSYIRSAFYLQHSRIHCFHPARQAACCASP